MTHIWIKNKKYYLRSRYEERIEAVNEAKQRKKKKGGQWFIIEQDYNYMFPEKYYEVYTTK